MKDRKHMQKYAGLALVGMISLLSCGDAGLTDIEPFGNYSIQLSPSELNLKTGETAQVEATLVDRDGRPSPAAMSRHSFVWRVADSALASVNGSGPTATVHALAPGDVEIEVEAVPLGNSPSGMASSVASGPLRKLWAYIRASAGAVVLQSGADQTGTTGSLLPEPVTFRVTDRSGNPVMGVRVEFSPSSGTATPAAAETDINGLASTLWRLGSEAGEQTLAATVLGVPAASASATATAPGAAELTRIAGHDQQASAGQALDPLRVRLTDAAGRPVRNAEVAWAVTAGGGTITPETVRTDSTGTAAATWTVGTSAGTHRARATHGGLGVNFTATVGAGPAAQLVAVAGDGQSAQTGARLPDSLAVRVQDAHGNSVAGATVTWTVTSGGGSVTPAQGTSNSNGMVRTSWRMGSTAGSASIRASVQGAGNTTFTATALGSNEPPPAPAVTRVAVTPDTLALDAIGARGTLTGRAYDSSNAVVSGARLSWTSLNTSVATVDTAGHVTARGTGTALVVVASMCCGVADTAAVVVTQRVASLSVSPKTMTLAPGGNADLTAVARDANSNVIASPSLMWSSSASAVATVVNGRVTAHAAGTAVIRAIAGTVRDSAVVTVANPEPQVNRVAVTPESATLEALGAQVALSGLAYDANGNVVLGARLRWSTLNSTVATVDSMGRVTARAVGTAMIVLTAVCCDLADTTAIEVIQRAAALDVTPASLTLAAGQSQSLTVEVRDGNGNAIPSPSVTWSSSNAGVASVSQGQVTAVTAGSAVIRAVSGSARDSAVVTVTQTSPPPPTNPNLPNECATPQPGWIWCDDFSSNRLSSYFEYDNAGGRFVRESSVGVDGSAGMRATFNAGATGAGSLKLAFGRTPDTYMRPVDAGTANYREIYWRVYVRNAPDWTGGGGDKLTRAVVFAGSNWSEAAIGHVWSGGSNHNHLVIDPASGTDTQGNLRTTRYNDFANLRWLGAATSTTPLFSSANVGQWYCVETRMRLNDAGQSNGVFEMWINGRQEAQRTGLNWLGSYNAYGINALFLENFWNDGAPRQQTRYFDNLVVSTQRIGCGDASTSPPPPPPPAPVASVAVSPSSASLAVGGTRQFTATLRDASGNTLTGRTITWSSTNTNVATVSSSGVVTARAAGSATIRATSEGVTGSGSVTVTSGSSNVPPDVVEDFSTYTSTSQFLSDPRGIYNRVEDINTGRMALDPNVGYGTSGQALRYDYPAGTATDYTISRNLRVPNATEIWVEAVVRFGPEFTFRGNGQGYSAGMKLLHVNIWPDGNGRFALDMLHGDAGNLSIQGASDAYDSFFLLTSTRNATLMDGNWHVLRYHVRLTGEKMHELWVNGQYMGRRTGVTRADAVWGVSLARNLNMVADIPMRLWWGKVSYWTRDPGW